MSLVSGLHTSVIWFFITQEGLGSPIQQALPKSSGQAGALPQSHTSSFSSDSSPKHEHRAQASVGNVHSSFSGQQHTQQQSSQYMGELCVCLQCSRNAARFKELLTSPVCRAKLCWR